MPLIGMCWTTTVFFSPFSFFPRTKLYHKVQVYHECSISDMTMRANYFSVTLIVVFFSLYTSITCYETCNLCCMISKVLYCCVFLIYILALCKHIEKNIFLRRFVIMTNYQSMVRSEQKCFYYFE